MTSSLCIEYSRPQGLVVTGTTELMTTYAGPATLKIAGKSENNTVGAPACAGDKLLLCTELQCSAGPAALQSFCTQVI